MTDETAEKLPDQLDKLRAAAYSANDDIFAAALVDYFGQAHAELAGRLGHADEMQHQILAAVCKLVDELESWRPLLDMFRPNGTRQPDWISVGQTVRTARREAKRNGGDQRAGTPRGSRARGSATGRQLPDA